MTPEPTAAPLMVAPFRLDSLRERAADAPGAGPAPEPPRPRRRGRSRLLVALVVLVLLLGAAAAFVRVRLSAADPLPAVTPVLSQEVDVPANNLAPSLPWPATGQGAVAIPSIGVDVASGPEQPVPVASLTKLMTAYVVLRDHPMVPNEPGAEVTVTPADVTDYENDTVNDDSNAKVAVGENLTEQQLLGGLLVHSADNYADLLARWDAGSIPAFVAEMNAAAQNLGMHDTHFADASGVSPGSESTAADILKVAAADMANPVVDADVRMSSVTLPLAGTITTYTPLLGVDGIIGTKSGFTTAAGGCDVVAVERTIHGQTTLLLAAVTGQTGPEVLGQAGLHGLALVNAVTALVGSTSVLRGGDVVAQVTSAGAMVDGRAGSSVTMLTWPGVTARRVFRPAHLTDRARRGAVAGAVVVTLGTQHAVVPVRLSGDVSRPSMLHKLF